MKSVQTNQAIDMYNGISHHSNESDTIQYVIFLSYNEISKSIVTREGNRFNYLTNTLLTNTFFVYQNESTTIQSNIIKVQYLYNN